MHVPVAQLSRVPRLGRSRALPIRILALPSSLRPRVAEKSLAYRHVKQLRATGRHNPVRVSKNRSYQKIQFYHALLHDADTPIPRHADPFPSPWVFRSIYGHR
jgi:hypothetical protein